MKIGVGIVEYQALTLYGYSDDDQVQVTIRLTIDELLELLNMLNQAPDVMRGLKPGDDPVAVAPTVVGPSR